MTPPDTLPPELAELGELLREDRPRPDDGWARLMDERMTAGFPERAKPVRPRRSRRRLAFLRPVLVPGVAVVLAGTIGTAVYLGSHDTGELLSGTVEQSDSAGGGAAGGDSEVAGGGPEAASGGSEAAGGDSAVSPSIAKQRDSAASAAPSGGSEPAPALSRPVPPAPGGGSPGSDDRRSRAVERSAALTLAAAPREVDAVADGVVRVTDSVGGFVASSSVYGSSGSEAYGSFELRIPTARLQRALADLSRLAHVRERSQASRDITAQTVSARDRLQEARQERQSLLRQLGRAVTINETDSLKARLRLVNRRIGAARASVERVTNRASFANVSVAVVADAEAGAAPDGGWTPGDAFDDAVQVLEVAAGVLLIALALGIPLALLAGLGWLAGRVVTRRRRERALDLA
jgi:hypothetical protein